MNEIGAYSEMVPISGKYVQTAYIGSNIVVEHCAFLEPEASQWFMDVRCRSGKQKWDRLRDACPDAQVEVKSNDILISLPSLPKELELTVFGKPGECDVKRMQMCIFGRKPVKGRNWVMSVYLCDDTVMAFENVYKKETKKGNRLLTTRAGLFVANSDEDIKISVNALEAGWQIKGNGKKTIKSRNAWNSPDNATDFPCLHFEVSHVDEMKQSFFCGITASHGTDIAEAEIRAFFKQENEMGEIHGVFKVCEELQANDDWTGNGSPPATMIFPPVFTAVLMLLYISRAFLSSIYRRESVDVVYGHFVWLVGLIHTVLAVLVLFYPPVFITDTKCSRWLDQFIKAKNGLPNTTSFQTALVGWMMFLEPRFKETYMYARRVTGRLFRSLNFLTAPVMISSSSRLVVRQKKSQNVTMIFPPVFTAVLMLLYISRAFLSSIYRRESVDVVYGHYVWLVGLIHTVEVLALFYLPVFITDTKCSRWLDQLIKAKNGFPNTTSFQMGLVGWIMFLEPRFKETYMYAKRVTGRLFRPLNFLTALVMISSSSHLVVRENRSQVESGCGSYKAVAIQPADHNHNCQCTYHTLPSQEVRWIDHQMTVVQTNTKDETYLFRILQPPTQSSGELRICSL